MLSNAAVLHGAFSMYSSAHSADASGNAYKTMFENTTMTSGLYFVVLINITVAWLGILFHRYVVLRQVGLLSPSELLLLRKYPPVHSAQSYTPEEAFVRSAPPMRWTGWRAFITASDHALSRDAQLYLLFQRACIATTLICAGISFVILLPSYWFGGGLDPTADNKSHKSVASMLRNDRGIFERFTSHNLPKDSPLVILQLPVLAVAALCVVLLYTIVQAAARDHRTLEDWLKRPITTADRSHDPISSRDGFQCDFGAAQQPASHLFCSKENISRRLDFDAATDSSQPLVASHDSNDNDCSAVGRYGAVCQRQSNQSEEKANCGSLSRERGCEAVGLNAPVSPAAPVSPISGVQRFHGWTFLVRGISQDIESKEEVFSLLCAIYPGQIRSVELVCKGRMSEARLLKALSTARNRLDYLHDTVETEGVELFDEQCMCYAGQRDRHTRLRSAGGDKQREEPRRKNLGAASSRDPGILERAHAIPSRVKEQIMYWIFGKKRSRETLLSELQSEIESLEQELASQKHEPVLDFRGCAFVTVRTSETAYSLLHDFPVQIRSFQGQETHARAELLLGADSLTTRSFFHMSDCNEVHRESILSGFSMQRLYRGFVMLLPRYVRNHVLSSRFLAPRELANEHAAHGRLTSRRTISGRFTRESAIARLCTMKAERAPKSGDIIWRNVGISFFERTCRELIVQILAFALLILFTSPVAILTALRLVFAEVALISDLGRPPNGTTLVNNITAGLVGRSRLVSSLDIVHGVKLEYLTPAPNSTVQSNAVDDISKSLMDVLPSFLKSSSLLRSVLLSYIPVLLLALVFSLVPTVLRAISNLEGYSTQSAKEMSVFRKTAFYYVMNAVVLPSLALNTASEFLAMLYKQSDGGANVYNALPILQRVFSGDIAFFLCNYLVQLSLTGSVFWLMRLPASFSMMVRRRVALTPLEVAEAKCTGIFDFPRHYAYSVTVLSMCLLFGFMAPLIWWFALMYYICKHAVDTYLIRYVHPRSHIDGRLPRLGANFVLIWTCLSQIFFAMVFYLQGWVSFGIFTAVLCALTLIACLSAGPHVGYRLLSLIPQVRDAIIHRLLSSRYGWLSRRFGQVPPSPSSSSASMVDVDETTALVKDDESASVRRSSDPGNIDPSVSEEETLDSEDIIEAARDVDVEGGNRS